MLKRLLITCMALCSVYATYAQVGPVRNCAAQEIFEKQNNNPKVADKRQQIEQHTRAFLQKRSKGMAQARTGVLTIPVIVHVIYSNAQENISDAQIQSQIDVLNEDFRKLNSDVSGVPSEFTATDMQIEFTLAQITRKSSSRTSWGTNDDMKKSSQGGVDPIDPAHNMNMWICNIGGGILGYAQFPGGPASTDGVVFSPQYCGSRDKQPAGENFYLSAPFDKGRTATHEVGHYLNLRHIWGDGNCNVDDFVSDTPTASAPNYGCPNYPSKSCNSNGGFTSDMFMNYMDYVDDACMFMFTAGQKARVDAIFEPGGAREELGSSTGGCSLAAPSGLASSNIGDNSFTLSWNAVSGAASYDVSVGGTVTTVTGTSRTFTGLTAGTAYACKVRANCDSGSGAYSSEITVTTTGSNCSAGPVTLTLVLDNYPAETSWSVTSGGSTVASGSGYSTKGGTVTETFNVGAGAYTFTINDSYGDGICCSYGNGSYTLRDANNNVIATGGDFGSTESVNYCTEGSGADTQAPTAPGSLSASGVTQTSATVSWTASTDNVGVTGYDVYVNGSLNGTTTSTSRTITGLTASTTYTVAVRAKDAAGNESSASSVSVTTLSDNITYCDSKGNNTSDEWIQRVQLGSIDNNSGSNGGYADFTSLSTSINPGSSYTITITPAWAGTVYREAYGVWIDYNQDGDFADSGEQVYSRSRTNASSISGSFTVPSSALSGATRMRVSMKYNANPTSCETFTYGEVEDYTVVVGGSARSVQAVDKSDMGLFPNPAFTHTTVHFSVAGDVQDVDLSIFDAMGRSVYKQTIAQVSGSHDETIDISGLKKGLYHVVIRGKDLNQTKKLLVK
ncbi:fibronectin type III domain-containing protein [Fulvivirga kasyanovii]|uniref:T9SS type A sorting domain-containing protein n=1 Tax=Fulvivirga kasyanovii TaxID=396812 RepID=A0ABW9RTC6_9BACT|nr:GEVED domain-containing protein [Fulvivirga kasyanovii]MTI27253.1 T9SS type A sorting domain-containing protein [Fulvivirga kasyanovii]